MHTGQKSLSLLLIVAIAAAQLLCSCKSVMASLIPSPQPKVHACCEHNESQPSVPDRTCPHCNGTAAVMSALSIEPHANDLPALDLLAFNVQPIALIELTEQPIRHSTALQPPTLLPATTLLGQHCALQV